MSDAGAAGESHRGSVSTRPSWFPGPATSSPPAAGPDPPCIRVVVAFSGLLPCGGLGPHPARSRPGKGPFGGEHVLPVVKSQRTKPIPEKITHRITYIFHDRLRFCQWL